MTKSDLIKELRKLVNENGFFDVVAELSTVAALEAEYDLANALENVAYNNTPEVLV